MLEIESVRSGHVTTIRLEGDIDEDGATALRIAMVRCLREKEFVREVGGCTHEDPTKTRPHMGTGRGICRGHRAPGGCFGRAGNQGLGLP